MLAKLRGGPASRLATILALLAALCLVAPPAAIAFGHGENVVHCLANADIKDHGIGHDQHGAGRHDQMDRAQLPTDKAPGCCALFCLSALAPGNLTPLLPPSLGESVPPPRETHLHDRFPELLDPPPIPSLAV